MSVKRNIIANYLGQGWTAVMGLAFVPLYIRYLGIEAYGLIGFFALLQTWLSLLDFGLTPALSREISKPISGPNDTQFIWNLLRTVEIITVLIAITTSLVIWASSDWMATSWLQVQSTPLSTVSMSCALMGVVVGLRFIENIYRASIIGLQRQVTLNVLTSVLATVRGIGAVAVLILVSNSIEAFFIWQVAISLATLLIFYFLSYRMLPSCSLRPTFSIPSLRKVGHFSAGTFAISLLGFLLSQTDKLLLSKLLNLSEFAHYSLAAVLATYVRLLATSIDQAVYPKFVQLWSEQRIADLAFYYHRSSQLSVVLMGSVGISFAVFGDFFLRAWTQDPAIVRSVSPLLSVLVIGMVCNGLLNGPYYLQLAAGWTSLLLKTNVVMAIVFVPLVIWMVLQFGAMGAAMAWVAINLVYLFVVVSLMHIRLLPTEKWRWYLSDVALPLASGVLVALLIRQLLPFATSRTGSALVFILGGSVTLIASALSASHIRNIIFSKFRRAIKYA